ncbi:MAG: Flp pilus assembly protein CpaB [Bacillota bacterium]
MKKIKAIAIFSALAAAVLLYFFLTSLSEAGDEFKKEVVVAAVNIPSNTEITEDMISLDNLPEAAVLQNAMTKEELVLGKATSTEILAGEQILSGKLVTPGEIDNSTLAYVVKPDMRAITIAVDSVKGVAGMLKPQNTVDLIACFENDGNGPKAYSNLIAENITVLAVDSVMSKDGKEIAVEDENSPYTTITLQVTPKQAMEISMAEFKGQLRAVLRSPLDEKQINPPSLTLEQVMVN